MQRTIVVDFSAAFKVMFPDASDQRKPFYGFMAETIAVAIKTRSLGLTPILS